MACNSCLNKKNQFLFTCNLYIITLLEQRVTFTRYCN